MNENTPGALGKTSCPYCGSPVFLTIRGGPQRLRCLTCRASIELDVVHDGRHWTIRRVRVDDAAASGSR
ncbi:MAG: hypothetical protein JO332_15340 [Planctomycetaceae bacterium]|nr:hypothetical protein [Planctomycetaceae bacterium]